MMYYTDREKGGLFVLAAYGIYEKTGGKDVLPVVVFHPLDNEHSIFVMDEVDFQAKYKAASVVSAAGLGGAA